MSEDDRAAKAARAKALLKKRQQKKAADTSTTSPSIASPVSPPRTFSPAPSDLVLEEEKRDLSDIFNKNDADTSWLSSLTPAPTPPPRAASPQAPAKSLSPIAASHARSPLSTSTTNGNTSLQDELAAVQSSNASLIEEVKRLQDVHSKGKVAEELLETERAHSNELQAQYDQLQAEKDTTLENERKTIALLVSEKASLTAQVEHLEELESQMQSMQNQLKEERSKSHSLDNRVQQLQKENLEVSKRAEASSVKEKELTEKCREQERQIQLTTGSVNELRAESEKYQQKVHDLEEQIQNDDRVERLESSLKNTQDRADEFEFQLSKLKQTHATLKTEHEKLVAQARNLAESESEWKTKYSELSAKHAALEEQLADTISKKQVLMEQLSALTSQTSANQNVNADLQNKLQQTASDLATSQGQLQQAHNELKKATRRAEDAEQTQKNLQAEGTNLMRSLDEMRPKIVELTGTKLELAEKVEGLERALHERDSVISHLESSLDEIRDEKEQIEKHWKERLSQQEKKHAQEKNSSSDLQKAYAELQEELDAALASMRNLETERSNNHQETIRRIEEISHITAICRNHEEELSSVREELESRIKAQEEEQSFLERAQNEIESLRAEIHTKDEELERLRESISSPTSDAPRSLDDEMLSSLRQQHALDLSAAQSQIRALENSVFDAEAKSHTLQKQVNSLEDQLARASALSHTSSRPSSRTQRDSDIRRSSFGSHRPNVAAPLSRSVFEQKMTPETLHKRKISLSMLKARIDSEVNATSHPLSRALSPVHSLSGHESHSPPAGHVHRPRFLDESHVFWCNSCRGDLVIL